MKDSFTPALRAHLAGEVLSVAVCWRVERTDGVVMGFTSHDRDLEIDGLVYGAATGFSPSAVRSTARLDVDNLDVIGVLDSEGIDEADLEAGVYDFAEVQIFIVNHQDLSMGRGILRSGWIGEVHRRRGFFEGEIRGLAQKLQQSVVRRYLPSCDAVLGDARCTVDLAPHTRTGTVTGVSSGRIFTDSSSSEEEGFFRRGVVTFTSGANVGRRMEVREYAPGLFILVAPMPFAIEVGDEYSATRGCSNRLFLEDGVTPDPRGCAGFSNVVNFRGFPFIPGQDAILDYPDAR